MESSGIIPIGPAMTPSTDGAVTAPGVPPPSGAQFADFWARLVDDLPKFDVMGPVGDHLGGRLRARFGDPASEAVPAEPAAARTMPDRSDVAKAAAVSVAESTGQPYDFLGNLADYRAAAKAAEQSEASGVPNALWTSAPGEPRLPFRSPQQAFPVSEPGADRSPLAGPAAESRSAVVPALRSIDPALGGIALAESLMFVPLRVVPESLQLNGALMPDRKLGAAGSPDPSANPLSRETGRTEPESQSSGSETADAAEMTPPLESNPNGPRSASGQAPWLALPAREEGARPELRQGDGTDRSMAQQQGAHQATLAMSATPETGVSRTPVPTSAPAGDVAPIREPAWAVASDVPGISVPHVVQPQFPTKDRAPFAVAIDSEVTPQSIRDGQPHLQGRSDAPQTIATTRPNFHEQLAISPQTVEKLADVEPRADLAGRATPDKQGEVSIPPVPVRAAPESESYVPRPVIPVAMADSALSRRFVTPEEPGELVPADPKTLAREKVVTSEKPPAGELVHAELKLLTQPGRIQDATPSRPDVFHIRTVAPVPVNLPETLEKSAGHPQISAAAIGPSDFGRIDYGGPMPAISQTAAPGGKAISAPHTDLPGTETVAVHSKDVSDRIDSDPMVKATGDRIEHRTADSRQMQGRAALFEPLNGSFTGLTSPRSPETGRMPDLSTPRWARAGAVPTAMSGQPAGPTPVQPRQGLNSAVWRLDPSRPEIQPLDASPQPMTTTEPRGTVPVAVTSASAAAMPGTQHATVVVQQLVQASGQLARGPIEVSLSPDELGRVRMTLSAGEHGMILSIIADRDDTLTLLRRNIDMLSSDLRDLGFGNLAFQFGSGGSADGNRDRDREHGAARAWPGAERDEKATDTRQAQSAARLSADRLDLRL